MPRSLMALTALIVGARQTGGPGPERALSALGDESVKTRAGLLVIGAAIGTGLVGLLLLLGALQLSAFVRLSGVLAHAPKAMGALGVVFVIMAAKIYRQRFFAVIAGLVGSAAVFFASGGFFIFLGSRGGFSLIMMLTPLLALAAALVDGLAIGPVIRAARARRRLAGQGLDVDF